VTESPSALKGVPEVVDTATLRVEGKIVRLFGVEWARGGQAEDLTRYLRGRAVDCRLVATPDVYRCEVEGQDLSRAVLFNGGGRATADASPELAAAENHAKSERIGVWRK
jgi:endonuclease YncB( thermonuclease family)